MRLALVLAFAACGGTQPPATTTPDEPRGVVKDTRSELAKRRDAACDKLGPKLFACAMSSAKAAFEAGELTKGQYDEVTKPDMKDLYLQAWEKECKGDMRSRQVRVLEVCEREETECDPLSACLKNLEPQPAK